MNTNNKGYSTYEKVVMAALLIFFLGMLFMFFILPRFETSELY